MAFNVRYGKMWRACGGIAVVGTSFTPLIPGPEGRGGADGPLPLAPYDELELERGGGAADATWWCEHVMLCSVLELDHASRCLLPE